MVPYHKRLLNTSMPDFSIHLAGYVPLLVPYKVVYIKILLFFTEPHELIVMQLTEDASYALCGVREKLTSHC